MSQFRDIEVSVGKWPDERSYRVSTENGEPYRVEAVFYGPSGLTYREVKRHGTAWQRAIKAAGHGISQASPCQHY